MPTKLLAPTLAGYRRSWLRRDLVAGVSAGAVVIPQAMAYATIANLPVQTGLYTCMVPMVVYALLGGSRAMSVSTTSTIATLSASTMVAAGVAAGSVESLMTLTFLVGVVLLAARLLRLGPLVENISEATTTGLKAGVGLTVAAGQLPKLLGVPADPAVTGFVRVLWSVLSRVGQAQVATVLLAAGSLAVLVTLAKLAPRVPAPLVVVAGGIMLVAFAGLDVEVIPPVPEGLPAPGLPDFAHAGGLLPGALAIATMAFLETVSVARGVRRPEEPRIDSNRELLATGTAGLAGAFFHTMPPAGGFSQTAVALRAGARTQLTGLVTAALALAVALFLAPLLGDLPEATLGALVVVATLGLVEPRAFVQLWRVDRPGFWIAVLTGMLGLSAGLLPAVAAGVLFTLYLVLRELNRPHVVEISREPLVLRVDTGLYTANVRANTDEIQRRAAGRRAVIVDCSRLSRVSLTVMHAFLDLAKDLAGDGVTIYFAALPPDALATVRLTPVGREYEAKGRILGSVEEAVSVV